MYFVFAVCYNIDEERKVQSNVQVSFNSFLKKQNTVGFEENGEVDRIYGVYIYKKKNGPKSLRERKIDVAGKWMKTSSQGKQQKIYEREDNRMLDIKSEGK